MKRSLFAALYVAAGLLAAPLPALAQDWWDPFILYRAGTGSFAVASSYEALETRQTVSYIAGMPDGTFRWASARADEWLCGLSEVSGNFQSGERSYYNPLNWFAGDRHYLAPAAFLEIGDGNWTLVGSTSNAPHPGPHNVVARCTPLQNFSGFDPGRLQLSETKAEAAGIASVWAEPDSWITVWAGFQGVFDGGGEWSGIYPWPRNNPDPWTKVSFFTSWQSAGNAASATSVSYSESYYLGGGESKRYWAGRTDWRQGEGAKRLIHSRDGFCFLAAMSGKFRGTGEAVIVDIDPEGYWQLHGRSQQSEVFGSAECVYFGGV